MIQEIFKFNTELLGVKTGTPRMLEKAEFDWLIVALNEEITEFIEAKEKGDMVGCVDSLLDLAYFAVGGCVRMGLTQKQIEQCFSFINNANMMKKQGMKETRPTDGSVADAVKPADWVAPEQQMKLELGL